jgi:hypothetical protein
MSVSTITTSSTRASLGIALSYEASKTANIDVRVATTARELRLKSLGAWGPDPDMEGATAVEKAYASRLFGDWLGEGCNDAEFAGMRDARKHQAASFGLERNPWSFGQTNVLVALHQEGLRIACGGVAHVPFWEITSEKCCGVQSGRKRLHTTVYYCRVQHLDADPKGGVAGL